MDRFRAIHQFLPTLGYADAIGNQALYLQTVLRDQGFTSEIFAGGWDPRLARACHSHADYKQYSHTDNLVLLHFSIGGKVNQLAQQIQDQVALIYHNITPGYFFYGVNDYIAQLCDDARKVLPVFTRIAPAIADSPFNALELEALGFGVVAIVPPVSDSDRLTQLRNNADAQAVRHLFGKQDTCDWLFVGRQAPNKCIEDIIKSFYYYHTWIEPKSRLLLVGNGAGMELYVDSLYALVTQLGLDGAVVFGGYQPDGGLAAFYEMADLYISMSEHEGFCVPLIEAMHFNIPILAFNSTNVPYALEKAGVLINAKNHPVIAEVAHEMITNNPMRTKMIECQNRRLQAFSEGEIRASFLGAIQKLASK